MQRARIKICGITNPHDAQAAAACGADAVGMVLHRGSRRGISVEEAGRIVAALPPFVTPVLLFVDAAPGLILETAREVGVRHVQLHGHEPPEWVKALPGLTILKALHVSADTLAAELIAWQAAIRHDGLKNLHGFVLDTGGTGQPGGSGVPNDWQAIQAQQRAGRLQAPPHLIAAGGLTPETVSPVVRELRPWAVDVSSGVEQAPGRKDPEKIAAFIRAVRQADAEAG